MLLRQQNSFTKFPCFLHKWKNRVILVHKKNWPGRKASTSGKKNILHKYLMDMKNFLLSTLSIKLGLIKPFVKKILPKISNVSNISRRTSLTYQKQQWKKVHLLGMISEKIYLTATLNKKWKAMRERLGSKLLEWYPSLSLG